jgi:hypothetical protein
VNCQESVKSGSALNSARARTLLRHRP